MDKNRKIKIITKELYKKQGKKEEKNTYVAAEPKQLINILANIKKEEEISIFDITYNEKKPKLFVEEVSDHINQTGESWLRGKQKQLQIDFVDVTSLYFTIQEKKTITTSLGKYYKKNKREALCPSTDLCNIAITLKALGYIKIKGRLINYNT